MTSAELAAVRLPHGNRLSSLDSTLRRQSSGPYARRTRQMEIKWQPLSSADLRSFVTAIRRHRMQAHVIITSGDLGVLRVLSQIAPDVRRALVWYPNHSRPSPREVPRYVQMINVDQSQASARYVRAARRLGLLVSARNADRRRQWRRLLHRRRSDRPAQPHRSGAGLHPMVSPAIAAEVTVSECTAGRTGRWAGSCSTHPE